MGVLKRLTCNSPMLEGACFYTWDLRFESFRVRIPLMDPVSDYFWSLVEMPSMEFNSSFELGASTDLKASYR